MDDVELQHWMHVAGCRALVVAVAALDSLLGASQSRVADRQQDFQVRVGVAPLAGTGAPSSEPR